MPKYEGPSRPGSPIKISRSGPSLSHLLFTDDILLLGKATLDNCNTIVGILDEFFQASGQKINFGKSFSAHTEHNLKGQIALALNVPVSDNLGTYLGCPIHHERPSKQAFQLLVDKVNRKLAGWKGKCLLLAGCSTLI